MTDRVELLFQKNRLEIFKLQTSFKEIIGWGISITRDGVVSLFEWLKKNDYCRIRKVIS